MMRFIQIEVKNKRIACFLDHFGRVLALGVSWETIKLVFYVFDQFRGGWSSKSNVLTGVQENELPTFWTEFGGGGGC